MCAIIPCNKFMNFSGVSSLLVVRVMVCFMAAVHPTLERIWKAYSVDWNPCPLTREYEKGIIFITIGFAISRFGLKISELGHNLEILAVFVFLFSFINCMEWDGRLCLPRFSNGFCEKRIWWYTMDLFCSFVCKKYFWDMKTNHQNSIIMTTLQNVETEPFSYLGKNTVKCEIRFKIVYKRKKKLTFLWLVCDWDRPGQIQL